MLTPHIGVPAKRRANIGAEVASKLIRYSDNGSTPGGELGYLSLPAHADSCRLLHIHRNQPGVLGAHQCAVLRAKHQYPRAISANQRDFGLWVIDADSAASSTALAIVAGD